MKRGKCKFLSDFSFFQLQRWTLRSKSVQFCSLQEFLLAIDVTSSGTPEEKLKWAFRMYDVDGNGVIDIQEMTKIVQVLYFVINTHTLFFIQISHPSFITIRRWFIIRIVWKEKESSISSLLSFLLATNRRLFFNIKRMYWVGN